MNKDPIVEEVRKHRREIEKESHNDLSRIFSMAKKIEEEIKKNVVSKKIGRGRKRKSEI